MKTTLMKTQLLQPVQIKTTPVPKSSSFNSPSYFPALFLGKGIPNYLTLSSKPKYWVIKSRNKQKQEHEDISSSSTKDANDNDDDKEFIRSLQVFTGAASIGFLLIMMGQDKAWALGPEGPLMEEFWENVRRYALYALTVSTGVIYTVLQPIVELLKNPISALLIIIIIGGSFFIVSQILSAMVGVNEFSYQYAY